MRPIFNKAVAGTIFTLGLALASAGSSPSALAANSESQGHFSEAQELLGEGKINAAIIELKNAIKADNTNAEARVQLGLIYLQNGDAAAAEKELNAGLTAGADRTEVLVPLGQALLQLGRADDLLNQFDPQAEDESIRVLLHVLRSNAQLTLGNVEEAEEEIETALQINDQIAEPHVGKAIIAQRTNDLEQAQQSIETALSFDENSYEVLFRLGDILRIQSKHEDAITYFDRALKERPNSTQAFVSRALSHLGLNNDESAENDAQAVLERDPNNALAKYVQAVVLTRKNEAQAALDILVTAPTLESFPAALYLLSNLYFTTEQYESARTYIEKYNALSDNEPNGQFLSALVRLAQNETQPAIDILEPLSQQFPDNYRIAATLAGAFLNTQQFEKASEYFDKASTLDPDNDQLKLRLAQSQLVGGSAADATGILEQFVEKNPDEESAFGLLIISYARSGEFDKAREAIASLKAKLPDSGLPYNFEAAIELAQNNIDAARGALEGAIEVQPDFSPARLNLARISQSEGDVDEARKQFQAILESEPGQIEALLGLAELARDSGDFDKANEFAEQAGQMNPSSARPGVFRAQNLLQQEEYDKARLLLSTLRSEFPDEESVLQTEAVVLENDGDVLGAISSLEQLSQLRPNNENYPFQIGRLHTRLQNYPEAISAFDRAIARDTNSIRARAARIGVESDAFGLERAKTLALTMKRELGDTPVGDILVGDILFRENNNSEALEYYQAAYDKEQSQAVLLQLYATNSRLGQYDQAKELMQAWLSENESDIRVRSALSDLFIRTKDYTRAIEQAEKVIEANPENAAVLNNLAWLYGQTNRVDEAKEYAEKAYEAQPVPAIADTLGWLLFKSGETGRALELLRAASDGLPDNGEVNYHLAAALNANGDLDEAREVLKGVLDSGSEFDDLPAAKELYKELTQ